MTVVWWQVVVNVAATVTLFTVCQFALHLVRVVGRERDALLKEVAGLRATLEEVKGVAR